MTVSARTTHLAAGAFVVGLAILLVARGESDGITLAMLLFALAGVRGIYAVTGHDQLSIADLVGTSGSRVVKSLGYAFPAVGVIILGFRFL